MLDVLVSVLKMEWVPSDFSGMVTYHYSCSGLGELGVTEQPRAILVKLPGMRLVRIDKAEICCCVGGTFSIRFASAPPS